MTINPFSIIVILVLGVLFFGKNLPGVARKIGSAMFELRRGVDEWKELQNRSSGIGSSAANRSASGMQDKPEEHFESSGTKFEPPS